MLAQNEQQPFTKNDLFSLLFSDNRRDISDIVEILSQQNMQPQDPLEQLLGMQNQVTPMQQGFASSPSQEAIMQLFNNPDLAFMLEGGIL